MHWVTIHQLYRDTDARRLAWAQPRGHDMAGLARNKAYDTATAAATIRPREGTTRPAVRARGLASGLCRDTQHCIVTEARGWPLGGCVTIQSLYRDKRAVWLRACHDTIDCIVIGGAEAWPLGMSRYNVATQPGLRCDTIGQAHDMARHACDMAGHKL